MSPGFRRLRERALQVLQSTTGPVPSPCQSVCVMHAGTGWCEGCLRSLPEIAAWSGLDDAEKRRIWGKLPDRMLQVSQDRSI